MDTAAAFRQWITTDAVFTAHECPVDNRPMLNSKRGAMIAHLEDVCGGEAERRLFLAYVFGVDSSADLTCRQQNALYLWLAPFKVRPNDPDDKRWAVGNPRAAATAAAVVTAARLAAGQLVLL
jgi:hypothetical protein